MAKLDAQGRRIDPGLFVVLAICFLAIWPFLSHPGLPQETDAELHVFRLHELSTLVRGGELYPRWAPDFYHGYGYPIFNYYAPLTYYLGLSVETWPWFDAVDGVKAIFIVGLLAAGVGMYGFVRDNWGRRPGYVGAAMYVYSPYIQYIDPYARGVLPESFSLGLFPLALWSLDRLRKRSSPGNWAVAAVLVAAIVFSHNLMGLLFFGLLTAWSIWLGLGKERSELGEAVASETDGGGSRGRRLRPFGALILGLGMASIFWLPVLLERDAVNLETLIGEGDHYDFHTHFLSVPELLSFSKRLDWAATEPEFRFNLGVPQLLVGSIGLVLLVTGRARRRRQLWFFAASFIFLAWLMLPSSSFIWEGLPFLPYFQFPWRLLGAAAAMSAVLAGAAASSLEELVAAGRGRRGKLSGWISANGVTISLMALPLAAGLPLSQPAPWPDFGEVSTLRMSQIEHGGRWLGTTSTADYVPATVLVIPTRNGDVTRGFYEGHPLDRVNRAPGMIPEGATVASRQVRPLKIEYTVSTPVDFPLRLFIFDFPGWQVSVDGQRVATELGMPEGFIVVPVPAGEHLVEVKFDSTPARNLAVALSGVSLLLTIAFAWRARAGRPSTVARVPAENDARGISVRHLPDRPVLLAVVAITAVAILLVQPLGWLRFDSAPYTAEPADEDIFADFGGQAALIGYDLSATEVSAGDSLDVVLYWEAQTEMQINFQSFLHLLRPEGTLAAQSDNLNPGDFPTKRWPLNKYVRDEHTLEIPSDLPPGQYQLSAGLWVQAEGWRLPLLDVSGEQIGDNQVIRTLLVQD